MSDVGRWNIEGNSVCIEAHEKGEKCDYGPIEGWHLERAQKQVLELKAENERLRQLVADAYDEGTCDGFRHDCSEKAWLASDTYAALQQEAGNGR